MSGGPAALKILKNVIPQSQPCNAYYALTESRLRYAAVIWGSLSKTKLAAIQHLQDWASSVIVKARIKDSRLTFWLNAENIFPYDRNAMTYKIVNRLTLKAYAINTNRNLITRHTIRDNVKISRSLDIGRNCKKGFHYATLKSWNDTIVEFHKLQTLDRFKK